MPQSFVTHLESALDGTRFAPDRVHSIHQGRPLWVRYDLSAVRGAVTPADFASRPPSLWRYRELLPLPAGAEPVTLGEGMSPILDCPRLAKDLGLSKLWVKDESQLPTGSFKGRGMTLAVSMAKHLGLKRLALPTAGNAGGAAAAYAARAGLECYVFMPADTPAVNQMEPLLYGAKAYRVNGLITDCGKIVREGTDKMGWFDLSTLKEPYRLEGKKTMGLEIAEQFDWRRLPDVILYPTGGGTGLIGMWKAFRELSELGWLNQVVRLLGGKVVEDKTTQPLNHLTTQPPKLPRLVSCQSDGCAPIVRAFESGSRFADPFPNAHTIASGLRVPAAVGDFMMLDAIRESGGCAIAGRETTIADWMRRASAATGISVCPETAVCFDCIERLKKMGMIGADDEVLVFNTGAAQKYLEALPPDLPRLDKHRAIDYEKL
jgi:threonine synthase